jgi:hypothetical protein
MLLQRLGVLVSSILINTLYLKMTTRMSSYVYLSFVGFAFSLVRRSPAGSSRLTFLPCVYGGRIVLPRLNFELKT